jgi:hypothetical protein
MLVTVDGLENLMPQSDESVALSSDSSKLVGSFVARGSEISAALKLRPNAPQTRGALVVSVSRENESWFADAELDLSVEDGFVDAIRLEIPPQWNEPFQLDPPLAHQVVAVAGEKRRLLLIQPTTPIKDHFRGQIRGRLSLVGGERLRAPEIMAPWIGHLNRFVVLPAQAELHDVEWETSGLQGAKLPAELRRLATAADAVATYQVVGEHFQAALKSVEQISGTPQARLADMNVVWHPDGFYFGSAAFDLEPAGIASCVFEAPTEIQILSATVSGVTASLEPAGVNLWSVNLASRQLPQQIEILFRGQAIESPWEPGRWRLLAPAIKGLEVERSLWTIHSPTAASALEIVGAANPSSPTTIELARLKSQVALLDAAQYVAADQSPDELARWYRPWRKLVDQSSDAARREQLLVAGRKPYESDGELQALKRLLDDSAAQLVIPADSGKGTPARLSQSARFITALHIGDHPAQASFRGPAGSIPLRSLAPTADDLGHRVVAATLFAAVGLLVIWLAGKVHLRTVSAETGVTALGLAWWLLLSPSLFGFALATFGAGLRLRRWRREHARSAV